MGRTILGPEENIKTLKSKDLRSYIDTHYTAPRMVVAAAGALDHEEVVRLAEEHWSGRPTTSSTDFPVDFDRAVFTPTEVRNEPWLNPRAPDPTAADLRRGLKLYRRAVWLWAGLLALLAVAG